MEINEIDEMVRELKNIKFPKSGKALTIFIFKINYINSSILKCCEAKDYYSTCILFRSLLEHYFRHLYIYTRTLRENSDTVGEEYYGKLKGYEDLTYLQSMQTMGQKLNNEKSDWELRNKHNGGFGEVGGKFKIKAILAFLNDGIKDDDIKPLFGPFFTGYCKKYYDLSSFVHGGPFAEGYISMYSKNKKGMNRDLEYFSKESMILFDRVVENTQLFLDLTKNTEIKKEK